jgi:RNA-directed DNA polymerase
MIDAENCDEKLLNSLWNSADWNKLESVLFDMQRDIALAAKGNDRNAILMYQKRLTQSLDAKMLVVRHVVANACTPGVDGIQWNTPSECMKAALSLNDNRYRALPMRLVVIYSKFSHKERHIKIPTYYDRAMQTLHAYALDPVGEACGDLRSFAFRKNRSIQDMHAHIMSALKKSIYYIVKADVKSCYESINHDWLLANIPMDTAVLREFLKCGHVSAGEFFPAEDHGISLGVSISPILGNMVLDGMQRMIFEGLHGLRYDKEHCDGHLIRFADDIFVTTTSIEHAKRIISIVENFLQQRGMRLSQEKTAILNIHQGFDFLSRHYVRNGMVIVSRPSDTALMKMEYGLRELILPFRGSQKVLIDRLNKKLHGWAGYHKISDARDAFRHIDVVVKTLLLQLGEQLHPSWKRSKIISRYFFLDHRGKYVYALLDKKDVQVIRLSDIVLIEHIPSQNANPYLLSTNNKELEELRNIHNIVGKYKTIWNRQDGRCFYCGDPLLQDQKKTIVHMCQIKSRHTKNIAYIHAKCEQHNVEFIDTEEAIENYEDISGVMEMLLSQKSKRKNVYRKFESLTEYFHKKTDATFMLTFEDLSNILGTPLCKSAFRFSRYWHNEAPSAISNTWRSNGYRIKSVSLKNQNIVFVRTCNKLPVKIPEIFLHGRVPKNAKTELETFLKYLMKKYGL